jgi:hypothetical protein
VKDGGSVRRTYVRTYRQTLSYTFAETQICQLLVVSK